MNVINKKSLFIAIFIPAITFVYLYQFYLINHDVAWLVHVGDSWLNNGQYFTDYYETNPPLAFYIYLPVHYIMQFTHLSIQPAFAIYYSALTIIIQLVTINCLKEYGLKPTSCALIILYLACWYYFIPVGEIGQRDQLSCMLVLPHILQSLLFLRETHSLGRLERNTATALAVIGYMLKPQFVVVWLTLFVMVFFQSRSIKKSMEICQAKLFSLSGLVYILIIYLFHANYLTKIIPTAAQSYYSIFDYSRLNLIAIDRHYIFKSWAILLIVYVLSQTLFKEKKPLYLAGFCIATAYMLTYLVQGIGFIYHAVPGLMSITLALFLISFGSLKESKIFIVIIFISFCIVLVSSVHYVQVVNRRLSVNHKLEEAIKILPKNSSIGIYICEISSYYSVIYQLKIKYKSSFPGIFQACLAHNLFLSRSESKPFYIWSNMLLEELNRTKPEYIISNPKNSNLPAEETFLKVVLGQSSSDALEKQYQIINISDHTVVYKRVPTETHASSRKKMDVNWPY